MKRGKYNTYADHRWCGIYGIKFVWHGEWADPEIIYRGYAFNCHLVEDYMVELYREEGLNDADLDAFADWMYAHRGEVREQCQYVIDNRKDFGSTVRCVR